MIKITEQADTFLFTVKGFHKLWAFKSELEIPKENILDVYQDEDFLKSYWKGWRIPGTHVPTLITAGTFYLEGDKIFWDVVDKNNTIIIDLQDESYKKLVIEVENPEEAMALLKTTKTVS